MRIGKNWRASLQSLLGNIHNPCKFTGWTARIPAPSVPAGELFDDKLNFDLARHFATADRTWHYAARVDANYCRRCAGNRRR